ncbi:MAG: DNA-directed RNA polymerase subunit omega [Deltaproteobacteria bacterium]|nr:DNA-directed RNA polymerase subunit omega [Deltaproteobacteria bacterium]
MARVTIEDCLKQIDNRFALVHMAVKRVLQIREGKEILIENPKNKEIVIALREIAANKIRPKKEAQD